VKGTHKKACPVEEAMLASAAKTGSKRKAAQSAARVPKKK
jgi:hypothetical protein